MQSAKNTMLVMFYRIHLWQLLRVTAIIAPVAPVVQLDRTSACGAGGHRFESCRVYQMNSKAPSDGGFFYNLKFN